MGKVRVADPGQHRSQHVAEATGVQSCDVSGPSIREISSATATLAVVARYCLWLGAGTCIQANADEDRHAQISRRIDGWRTHPPSDPIPMPGPGPNTGQPLLHHPP